MFYVIGLSFFAKKNLPERSPMRDRFPRKDNNPRKNQKRLIRECKSYHEIRTTPLNDTLTEVFTTIKGKEFI